MMTLRKTTIWADSGLHWHIGVCWAHWVALGGVTTNVSSKDFIDIAPLDHI